MSRASDRLDSTHVVLESHRGGRDVNFIVFITHQGSGSFHHANRWMIASPRLLLEKGGAGPLSEDYHEVYDRIKRSEVQGAGTRSRAAPFYFWIEDRLHAVFIGPEFLLKGAARLLFIGAGDFHVDDLPAEIRRWREETEVDDIQEFDVGVMPLHDELFERGKCGYKLIQYMACQAPVVGSGVGANLEIIEHGKNGSVANSTNDWVEALKTLREERELRKRMGRAGRLKVEARYCLRATAPRLTTLLKNCL
ncbi:MAG: glycosyltransferase family 4 protein [Desulfobacterales bacterium]|nr:glycosyltransferase family 4 protein [Desulfobacterales bacterium]